MKMKTRMRWLFLALVVVALCGCQRQNQEGDSKSVIITMPTSAEPEAGFDPVYGWGAGEHVHEPLIQSTLTTTTTSMEVIGDLALDFSVSEDGLVWSVQIRDDVYFSDGEKLDARDVVFTYNTCKEQSLMTDFTMLDYADFVDEERVDFYLNKPFSLWPHTMANIGIVPEHSYQESYGQNPVGSGPYLLRQWDKGQQVILEANPYYYGEPVKMERVTILFMDEDSALAAVLAGQVDVGHTTAAYGGEERKGYGLLAVDSVDNRGFNLPAIEETLIDGVLTGNDVTADASIRRAINLGIDRDLLIDHVLGGYGTKAYSVCDQMPWFNEETKVLYDFEKATQILEEGGWIMGEDGIREKEGLRANFTLYFNPGDSLRQALAEEVSNQLALLGIQVDTAGAGWDTAYEKAQSQALVWGWGSHTPMELYNLYHTTNGGLALYSPYKNEAMDDLMDQALEATDLEASYSLWQEAQNNEDLPFIWLCNVQHLYYVREGLEVAEQKIHPHGQGWSLVNNVDQWEWSNR